MADSAWSVQKALYETLAADAALIALLADGADSICDHVPDNADLPYIVIGEMAARPSDTQDAGGCDLDVSLHCYSAGKGFKEARLILARAAELLHDAALTLEDHHLVLCLVRLSETLLENNGTVRHGVLRLRVVTEPV